MTPVPVAPQQLRLEPLDELGELRAEVRVDVALAVGVIGVPPVEERVVEPEDEVVRPGRVGELGDDVALAAPAHARCGR